MFQRLVIDPLVCNSLHFRFSIVKKRKKSDGDLDLGDSAQGQPQLKYRPIKLRSNIYYIYSIYYIYILYILYYITHIHISVAKLGTCS